MKNFNRNIEITIEVDSIAHQLLNKLDTGKNSETIVETIIGNLLNSGNNIGIGQLFNVLNGYSNDINFSEGEMINCLSTTYQYSKDTEGVIVENNRSIGICTIIEKNLFSESKLRVQYDTLDSKGNPCTRDKWVNHLKCRDIEPTIVL